MDNLHPIAHAAPAAGRSRLLWRALLLCAVLALAAPGTREARGQETVFCTVVAPLKMRSGPGTGFNEVAQLAPGTRLIRLGYTTSAWLQVQTVEVPVLSGYVRWADEYVLCFEAGPFGVGAQGVERVIAPPPATDEGEGLLEVPLEVAPDGDIVYSDEMAPLLFEHTLALGANLELSQVGQPAVAGFSVLARDDAPNTWDAFNHVYALADAPGLCIFGGSETCDSVRLREGATWPGTATPVENGSYTVVITLFDAENDTGGVTSDTWRVPITIDSPALELAEEGP